MGTFKTLLGIAAALAFIAAAIYSVWFRGYSPLHWPIQLAYEGFQAIAAPSEKVWLVADFTDDNGRPGKMSFNNPSVPDLSLADCEASLEDARPHIIESVRQAPSALGVTEVTLSCVASDDDPIRQ